MSARAPLGQLLVEAGLLSSEALAAALRAHVSDPPVADPTQVVLVVAAPKSLVRKCRMAAAALDARVQATDFADAGRHVRELSPFALVVTEDVYAFDRLGISNLALTAGALLVIWSDELDAEYLEPLLDTAYRHRNER